MSIATTPPITIEQLLASEDRGSFEIVNGALQEVHVSNYSTYVAVELITLLHAFCRTHQRGQVFGAEGYYRCFGPKKENARKPDISFISFERLPARWMDDNYFCFPPDLAIEVLSPNDTAYEVNQKIKEYLTGGVRLIWIIDPVIREVMIYRPDGSIHRLQDHETLSGEDVLPGFTCVVKDFLLAK